MGISKEQADILWEAYKILRDVCEEDGQCPNCILYESCKDLPRIPHRIIKDFHYDLYAKPILDKER